MFGCYNLLNSSFTDGHLGCFLSSALTWLCAQGREQLRAEILETNAWVQIPALSIISDKVINHSVPSATRLTVCKNEIFH